MAWSDEVSVVVGPEIASGDGTAVTGWLSLNPRELYHIFLTRTDVSPTNSWLVEVEGSTDGIKAPYFPRLSIMLTVANLKYETSVVGMRYMRIRARCASGGANKVKATISYVKDGGL